MATFIIRELQNANSTREGVQIDANDLSMAKRAATKMQAFHGTVMIVENESGRVLATKDGKSWINA